MEKNESSRAAAPQWATPLWFLGVETDSRPHWAQQWGSCHVTSYWQPSHRLMACSTIALVPGYISVCVSVWEAMDPLMHIINHTFCQTPPTLPSMYYGFGKWTEIWDSVNSECSTQALQSWLSAMILKTAVTMEITVAFAINILFFYKEGHFMTVEKLHFIIRQIISPSRED